jgi:hypothetical protein
LDLESGALQSERNKFLFLANPAAVRKKTLPVAPSC